MSNTSVTGAYDKLVSDIRNRVFAPVYLLAGEEPYFIDALSKLLEETILNDGEKGFNQTILYGKDTKVNELMMAARRYPMGAPYQVIILKEAQMMANFAKLDAYLENPQLSTILVLCFKEKKPDMRQRVGKLLSKPPFVFFESNRIRDYQIKDWVERWVRLRERNIDPRATDMLVDYLGTDLNLITGELEKIFLTIKDPIIQVRHVQDNVGMSREYNVFELIKALAVRNFNKTIQIAHNMAGEMDRNPPQASMANLYTFYNRLNLFLNSRGKSKEDLVQAMGLSPKQVDIVLRELQEASRHYKSDEVDRALGYLKYFDLRFKGMNQGNASRGQLWVELMVNLLKN